MAEAGLHRTIPALPVRAMGAAVDFYVERFGFAVLHRDGGFAVLGRDDAVLHLWEAGDEAWRVARGPARAAGVLRARSRSSPGPRARGSRCATWTRCSRSSRRRTCCTRPRAAAWPTTDFGTREFATLDLDGNLLSFFRWETGDSGLSGSAPGSGHAVAPSVRGARGIFLPHPSYGRRIPLVSAASVGTLPAPCAPA